MSIPKTANNKSAPITSCRLKTSQQLESEVEQELEKLKDLLLKKKNAQNQKNMRGMIVSLEELAHLSKLILSNSRAH